MEKKLLLRDEGSLTLYLKEVAKTQVVTPEEEGILAARIRKGDRKALEKLVKANLRFVVSVAKNYQNQGIPLNDLINEGNLGLIKAARRFDESKNFKFISYAVWWIRQSILQALAEQSRIVKLPLNRVGTIHKIGKIQGKLEQKYCRKPDTNEIASELSINENDVKESLKIGNSHISLDAPIQAGEDSKLLDLLADGEEAHADNEMLEISLQEEVYKTLNMLAEREKEVVRLYFGIGEDTSHTLEEIGRRFNLTRERARQIKEKAIKRLKHTTRSKILKSYLG